MPKKNRRLYIIVATAFWLVGGLAPWAGCHSNDDTHDHKTNGVEKHDEPKVEGKSNRIAVPQVVRDNLGITFVTVERRPVNATMRLPGQFELRHEARREYHVMLAGRIDLLVDEYESIKQGQPLFHLDSPEWSKIQNQLVEALNTMKRSHADVAVALANLNEKNQSIQFLEQRIANLAQAKSRQVDLESELSNKRNTLPRLQAELDVAKVKFDAAHTRYEVMLGTAASLTGIPAAELDPEEFEHDPNHSHMADRKPPWRSVKRITMYAEVDGIVDRIPITNRGWAETGDLLLDTVNPTKLRFHAEAFQTDINLFSNGQRARVVPPLGGSFDLQDTIDGNVSMGFEAHSAERTVSIYLVADEYPTWAKAGVSAYLEVYLNSPKDPVLAIPESAVVRDGLESVFFRRNPQNPNEVIRLTADLGTSDGRWIEIKSGVREGDEIVLGGVYPLMLASSESGAAQKGGHFHSDGTFHDEKD